QQQWGLSADRRPASAVRDGVIADQILGRREHSADDLSARWRLRGPGIGRMHIEEYGALQADRAQHIRQCIHSPLRGRSSMKGGRPVIRNSGGRRYTPRFIRSPFLSYLRSRNHEHVVRGLFLWRSAVRGKRGSGRDGLLPLRILPSLVRRAGECIYAVEAGVTQDYPWRFEHRYVQQNADQLPQVVREMRRPPVHRT